MNWSGWAHTKKDVLCDKATTAESRLGAIKKAAKTFKKSVEDSLKTAPTKSRNEDLSVRKRRTAEFTLGDQVAATVHNLNDEKVAMNIPNAISPLNTVLERFANLEKTIGHMLAVNEEEVSSFIGSDTPLSKLLSDDIPAVQAAKKDLERLISKRSHCQGQLEKEQKKLDKMSNEEMVDPEILAQQRDKREKISYDLEILTKDVSLEQDKLTSTLLTLVSRENRYANSVFELMRLKKTFYENAFRTIEAEIPNIQRILEETNVRPVFGEDLEDHLKATGREIAYPIALSVMYLLDSGLTDEGLFRISAKQIKIDKFKAYLDSHMSLSELLLENDPHLHASVLKSYLRELPTPLLGGSRTYDRWLRGWRIQDEDERLEEFKDILATEHSELVAKNIQYVLKFLNELSSKSGETKMTPKNISIILGPTLLWANRGSETEQSNLESIIGVVATLIKSYHVIFENDIDLKLEDEDLAEVRNSALRLSESSYASGSVPSSPDGFGAAGAAGGGAGSRPHSILSVPGGGPKSLSPESPSPNQKRKPSIRGGMNKILTSNPVGRNIMSKMSGSSSQTTTPPPSAAVQHPSTATVMASAAYTTAAAPTRRSLQEDDD